MQSAVFCQSHITEHAELGDFELGTRDHELDLVTGTNDAVEDAEEDDDEDDAEELEEGCIGAPLDLPPPPLHAAIKLQMTIPQVKLNQFFIDKAP